MSAMRSLASWSPAQMAGRRLMPAIAAGLALLVAAILIAFNAVSAEETPTHQAAINDDPNLNRPLPTTTCDHSINSDATCDLSMRLWNRHTTTEATFTLLEVGVNGAFDSSTITPDNTERYSTQTLGDCPCEYTVPPRGYETFRVTIRVGTMTDGYRTSNIRIFRGTDMTRSQTPLNEYRLRLVDVTTPPDPTSTATARWTSTRVLPARQTTITKPISLSTVVIGHTVTSHRLSGPRTTTPSSRRRSQTLVARTAPLWRRSKCVTDTS